MFPPDAIQAQLKPPVQSHVLSVANLYLQSCFEVLSSEPACSCEALHIRCAELVAGSPRQSLGPSVPRSMFLCLVCSTHRRIYFPLQSPFTLWCGLSHRATKCAFLVVPQQTLRGKAQCACQVRAVAIWNMEWAFPVDSVILL